MPVVLDGKIAIAGADPLKEQRAVDSARPLASAIHALGRGRAAARASASSA